MDIEPNDDIESAQEIFRLGDGTWSVSAVGSVTSAGRVLDGVATEDDPVDWWRVWFTGSVTSVHIDDFGAWYETDRLREAGVSGETRQLIVTPSNGLSGPPINMSARYGISAHSEEFGQIFMDAGELATAMAEEFERLLDDDVPVTDGVLESDLNKLYLMLEGFAKLLEEDGENANYRMIATGLTAIYLGDPPGSGFAPQIIGIGRAMVDLVYRWEDGRFFIVDESGETEVDSLVGFSGVDALAWGNSGYLAVEGYVEAVRAEGSEVSPLDYWINLEVDSLTHHPGVGDEDDENGGGETPVIVPPTPTPDAETFPVGDRPATVSATLENLVGDTFIGFSSDDRIVIQGTYLPRASFEFDGPTGVVSIDADGDGIADGTIVLAGNLADGDIMTTRAGGGTTVTFHPFLPLLAEGAAVPAANVNGITNQAFLTGDGAGSFRVTLKETASADFDNALGVYEVDAAGNIVDVRMLIADTGADPSAAADITGVEAGNRLGFFIVQDGADFAAGLSGSDALSFVGAGGGAANVGGGVARLAVNGTARDVTVFHSFAAGLNPDGVEHVLSGVDAGGRSMTIGFEDLLGGGDRDYQDVVFRVEPTDGTGDLIL